MHHSLWRSDVTYATLLAHLDIGKTNVSVMHVASSLAQQLGANVVGLAASHPVEAVYDNGYMAYAAPEVLTACAEELAVELAKARAEFLNDPALAGRLLEWRASDARTPVARYIANEARCADLIITGIVAFELMDASRHTSIGDLVMRAGRPVLVVPSAGAKAPFERIVVAWKDTSEARRAIKDALPLLRRATDITIAEVVSEDGRDESVARLGDVVSWLGRHGIKAVPHVAVSAEGHVRRLNTLLDDLEADLVVAGAYGHSRLREWVFGGVTDSLLHGERCVLLSH